MSRGKTKSDVIYDTLLERLRGGSISEGARFWSESELAEEFQVSRPTVARALNRLAKAGMIDRRPGSGSYVKTTAHEGNIYAVFLPNFSETEILEPIYKQLTDLAERNRFSLVFAGNVNSGENVKLTDVERKCSRLIETKVSGIFFAAYELIPDAFQLNQTAVRMFDDAGIPIVLIDRDIVSFPERSRYDLVGIDNYRAGYIVTHHLLENRPRRIDFLVRPYSANTETERIKGYQDALSDAGITPSEKWVHYEKPANIEYIRSIVEQEGARDFVCGNDRTAVDLLSTFHKIGVEVPRNARVVGFDDVVYAKLLKIPLTTYRQPTSELANVAVELLLDRIRNPHRAPRRILLDGEIVIRESCGCDPPPL